MWQAERGSADKRQLERKWRFRDGGWRSTDILATPASVPTRVITRRSL